jgi:hypothetical protein
MRRLLIGLLGFGALGLSLGCRHVAGVNDCGCDIPICGRCHCDSGCGTGHGVTVVPHEPVPPGKGKGSGSGSGSAIPKGSGSTSKTLPQI